VQPDISVFVVYTIASGEFNASQRILLEGSGEPQDLIHGYFEDFWGDETEVEIKGLRYMKQDCTEAIEINSMRMVDDTDAYVLRKYL
jgi:hypothetical protein